MNNETIDLETREIFQQEIVYTQFPFAEIAKCRNVVCEDKSRRTFTATSSADTFFSIPGYVQVNGTSVRGYLTRDEVWDDQLDRGYEVWKFIAYKYRKNWRLVNELST